MPASPSALTGSARIVCLGIAHVPCSVRGPLPRSIVIFSCMEVNKFLPEVRRCQGRPGSAGMRHCVGYCVVLEGFGFTCRELKASQAAVGRHESFPVPRRREDSHSAGFPAAHLFQDSPRTICWILFGAFDNLTVSLFNTKPKYVHGPLQLPLHIDSDPHYQVICNHAERERISTIRR